LLCRPLAEQHLPGSRPALLAGTERSGSWPQVRALCACELGLFTASRDRSVKLWAEGADGRLSVATTFLGHTSYVTAVAYIPPGAHAQWPKGALVTGAAAAAARYTWCSVTGGPEPCLNTSCTLLRIAYSAAGALAERPGLRCATSCVCPGVLARQVLSRC